MTKNQLKNYINMLCEQYLEEAKVDKLISIHPEYSEFLSHLNAKVKPKYLEWLLKVMKSKNRMKNDDFVEFTKNKTDFEFIEDFFIEPVNEFDKLSERGYIKNKDIGQYKDFNDLSAAITKATKEKEEKEKKKEKIKQIKSEKEIIYNDDIYVVLSPKSEGASCHYGKGTKWCISATEKENYFDQYKNQGYDFWFVINKQTNDKDAVAFNLDPREHDYDKIKIFNSADNELLFSEFEEKYPQLSKFVYDKLNFHPKKVYQENGLNIYWISDRGSETLCFELISADRMLYSLRNDGDRIFPEKNEAFSEGHSEWESAEIEDIWTNLEDNYEGFDEIQEITEKYLGKNVFSVKSSYVNPVLRYKGNYQNVEDLINQIIAAPEAMTEPSVINYFTRGLQEKLIFDLINLILEIKKIPEMNPEKIRKIYWRIEEFNDWLYLMKNLGFNLEEASDELDKREGLNPETKENMKSALNAYKKKLIVFIRAGIDVWEREKQTLFSAEFEKALEKKLPSLGVGVANPISKLKANVDLMRRIDEFFF